MKGLQFVHPKCDYSDELYDAPLPGMQLRPRGRPVIGTDETRVSVVFATIDRPEMVIRLVQSIRGLYPSVAIVMADQNPPTLEMDDLCQRYGIQRLQTPYDSGVTFGRNLAVTAAETEFVLICDDDFIFTPHTDISIPIAVLDERPRVGVVGGSIIDLWGEPDHPSSIQLRRFEKFIAYDARGFFSTIPIDYSSPISESVNGHAIYACDMV